MEGRIELHGEHTFSDLVPLRMTYGHLTPPFLLQHGTGHGFGAFLTVHEGPHGFSSNIPLVPGHVITNEPGFCQS